MVVTDPTVNYSLESYTLKDVVTTENSSTSGSVVVHYVDAEGNTIASDVVDTDSATVSNTVTTHSSLNGTSSETTPTGATFDTTDHKPSEISYNGHLYRIIPSKTEGVEKGTLAEGTSNVTYVYELIKGDVLVHYVDTEGNAIASDVVDMNQAPVNDAYDTTDHKPSEIEYEGHVYRIITSKTKGNEKGAVTEDATNVTYVYC